MATSVNGNVYLIQKLKSVSDPLSYSFSNRYTRWRHRCGIHKAVGKELQKIRNKPIKILDIGCNEGYLIFELKELFDDNYDIHFIGIDINPELIEFANQRKNFFQAKNCSFEVMDANELKFEDNQFDIITCASLIEHIENPINVLKEIYRVLKPSGSIILTTPNGGGGIPDKLINVAKLFCKIKEISKKNKIQARTNSTNTHGNEQEKYGFEHISVKTRKKWVNIFYEAEFKVLTTKGTSGLIYGSPTLDKHRVLFGIMVIVDVIIEHLLFSYLWSIDLLFVLQKK